MLELSYFCNAIYLFIINCYVVGANISIGQVVNCAMVYGTSMGLFWILKFMLVPFIFSVPFTSLCFLGLTVAVPFVGYFFARQYRDRYCPDGRVGFMQAWVFCMLMYAFAALLASVAHYIFFQYVDGGSMIATYRELLDELQRTAPELDEMVKQYHQAADLIASMTPIDLTIQLILNNIFYGMLLALPTALFVSLKRPVQTNQ